MIRPLSGMLHDVADTIFNIDSRVFHSLLPLYFRPGFLTREYFAGRRTRYVTPFRLYFFLSVLAFFTIQFTLGESHLGKYVVNFDDSDTPGISSAMTPQEVIARRDAELANVQLRQGHHVSAVIGATTAPSDVKQDNRRRHGKERREDPQGSRRTPGVSAKSRRRQGQGRDAAGRSRPGHGEIQRQTLGCENQSIAHFLAAGVSRTRA